MVRVRLAYVTNLASVAIAAPTAAVSDGFHVAAKQKKNINEKMKRTKPLNRGTAVLPLFCVCLMRKCLPTLPLLSGELLKDV